MMMMMMTNLFTVSNVITGPEAVYDNGWGTSDWSNPPGPTSWKCRCIQEPVQCQPEDGYEVGLVSSLHSLVFTLKSLPSVVSGCSRL